mmetsp:Transcript_27858/g.86749  ORF Transcript_27858/g.86749 Transcript_27858/m.86749 type:complete len:404 (-) Transcript_27858:18-1229(-)
MPAEEGRLLVSEREPDGLLSSPPGVEPGARGRKEEVTYYTESLQWFRVVFSPRVALRSMPSTQARTIGCLKHGEVFAAEEVLDGWARLAQRDLPFRVNDGQREAWALIDGTSRGLGPLLQPLEDQREATRLAAGARPRLQEGTCLFINLDRRDDRREHLEALVAPHTWLRTAMTRLPAVDGRGLSWPELLEEGLFTEEAESEAMHAERDGRATIGYAPRTCSAHLTLGGCGCALSHRRAWRALVNSDRPWALILEDDLTVVCRDFDDELDRVLEALPEDWDVCYLGYHTGLHGARVLPQGDHFSGTVQSLAKRNAWLPGLYGYILSRTFAKYLLQEAFPLYAQVDTVVGCILSRRGNGFAVPAVEFLLYSPPTEASRDTDIQTFPEDMGAGGSSAPASGEEVD